MELIDKAAVVAVIEKIRCKVDDDSSYCNGWKHALRMLEIEINTLEVKEVDEQKERISECPCRQVVCTMYKDKILECNGGCSWVVDYPRLKELKAQKGE